jgi:hypothetical protein
MKFCHPGGGFGAFTVEAAVEAGVEAGVVVKAGVVEAVEAAGIVVVVARSPSRSSSSSKRRTFWKRRSDTDLVIVGLLHPSRSGWNSIPSVASSCKRLASPRT